MNSISFDAHAANQSRENRAPIESLHPRTRRSFDETRHDVYESWKPWTRYETRIQLDPGS